MTLDVLAGERGLLRLFALNMSDDDARMLAERPEAAARLLGITDLDPDYAEIFAVENVSEIGLPGYLNEGYDVPKEALSRDRARLQALEGHVLVVLSMAFRDQPVTLEPGQELTLIGTYPTEGVDWTSRETISSDSARPYSAPPETVKQRPSDNAILGRIALLTLLVLAVLTYVVVWIAG